MSKGRLEAFSDGVLAIIITIMVLELTTPHEPPWTALRPLAPVFLSYLLSFVFVGIYWNNHHHLFRPVSMPMDACCGQIYICFFGFHSFPLPQVGWGKRTLPRGLWRSMA